MTGNEKPAMRGHSGPSVSVQLGGIEQLQHSSAAERWEEARSFEARSAKCGRSALIMRGADRFNALALASVYASAARATAKMGALG